MYLLISRKIWFIAYSSYYIHNSELFTAYDSVIINSVHLDYSRILCEKFRSIIKTCEKILKKKIFVTSCQREIKSYFNFYHEFHININKSMNFRKYMFIGKHSVQYSWRPYIEIFPRPDRWLVEKNFQGRLSDLLELIPALVFCILCYCIHDQNT